MLLFLIFLIGALPYVDCTNQQPDMDTFLTLYSVLCPSFHDVPANRNPSNLDATGGHFAELDTSYQTTMVDPLTDLPAACEPAPGLTFNLKFGTTTNSFQTAGAAGSVAVNMTLGLLSAIQSASAATGLSVSLLITHPGSFGQLRCYNEILNGDNLETIYGVPPTTCLVYCIAYTVPCSVNCVWGNWSDFCDCSASCGGGIQTRTRNILVPASNGGMQCSGNDTETQPCNTNPCNPPVNCVWGNWSDFCDCSASCGGGIQTRTRHILIPASNGGMQCSGNDTETRPCNTNPCNPPINCVWGNWSDFCDCSASCGGGIQTRTRHILIPASNGGMQCTGNDTETRPCNTDPCPGCECLYGNWTDWGDCSLSCGGGIQTRTRDLLNPSDTSMNCSAQETETQPCNTDPCPGCEYGNWSDWGNCSVPCGGGIQTRTKDLLNPDTSMNCSAQVEDTRPCNTNACNPIPVPMVVPMPAPLPTGPQNTCCYRFKNPGLPSFTLPLAQPNSPGDITLNTNNPIVLADGHEINDGQGCNGDDFEYWDGDQSAGVWRRDYTDNNGATQNNIDLFYATAGTSLNIRTIQTTQANIGSVLQRRLARLWITCNNGYYSCIQFTVGSTSQQLAGNENNGQCPSNITHCQKCNQPTGEVCTLLAKLQITSINSALLSRNLTLVVNVTIDADNCSNVLYELENAPDQTYADRLCALIAGQAQLDIRRVSCSIVPSAKRAGGFSVSLKLNDPVPDTATPVNVDTQTGSGSALSVSLSFLVFGLSSYLLF